MQPQGLPLIHDGLHIHVQASTNWKGDGGGLPFFSMVFAFLAHPLPASAATCIIRSTQVFLGTTTLQPPFARMQPHGLPLIHEGLHIHVQTSKDWKGDGGGLTFF